jgi:hypothetical protein
VNNIKNTMCRLSDLTQVQIDSLLKVMPDGKFCFSFVHPYIGVSREGKRWGTWERKTNPTIVTYTEMMQLLGKDMNKQTAQEQMAVMQIEMDKLKAIIDRPEAKTGRVLNVDDLTRADVYFFTSHLVCSNHFVGDEIDKVRINTGIAFHDKETAKRHFEYLKLEQELRRAQIADGVGSCKETYTILLRNTGALQNEVTYAYHEKISFNTEDARNAFRNTHTDEQLTLLIRGV